MYHVIETFFYLPDVLFLFSILLFMALRLANISDFGPAQDCVVMDTSSSGKLDLNNDDVSSSFNAIEPINVSLKSCLACSGCVTTSEVVLLSSQSLASLFKLKQPIVFSISPQVRASFGVYWDIDSTTAMRRLCGLLKTMFPNCLVVDMASAVDIALLATKQELLHRLNHEPNRLPLLVSACSGVVCYFEKLHPSLLNLLSSVPSPQFIQGVLVSEKFPSHAHVVVAPCHDRKLEAFREELNFRRVEGLSDNGVDCVVTASEVLQLITETSIEGVPEFKGPIIFDESDFDLLFDSDYERRLPARHQESGGYVDYVYSSIENSPPVWSVPKRKGDARHLKSELLGSHFSEVFGFREVQNLIRQIKKGKTKTSLVEVFACPSACINGGGLIGGSGGFGDGNVLEKTKSVLTDLPSHSPDENHLIPGLLERNWFMAKFTAREEQSNPAKIDW
ncbi:hypothetical protein RCL1_001292 [Eukaryota sp. TZLM3-RCL]